MNLYCFVQNNPASLTDPYGHVAVGPVVIIGIIGVAILGYESWEAFKAACHALKVGDDVRVNNAKKCLAAGEHPNPVNLHSRLRSWCAYFNLYK